MRIRIRAVIRVIRGQNFLRAFSRLVGLLLVRCEDVGTSRLPYSGLPNAKTSAGMIDVRSNGHDSPPVRCDLLSVVFHSTAHAGRTRPILHGKPDRFSLAVALLPTSTRIILQQARFVLSTVERHVHHRDYCSHDHLVYFDASSFTLTRPSLTEPTPAKTRYISRKRRKARGGPPIPNAES